MGFSGGHLLADGPFDVLGDGAAFLLSHGTIEGQEHLAVGVQGVDVLALEVDPHRRTEALEGVDAVQCVDGVPGEAGDGFGDDVVESSLAGVVDHAVEICAVFS